MSKVYARVNKEATKAMGAAATTAAAKKASKPAAKQPEAVNAEEVKAPEVDFEDMEVEAAIGASVAAAIASDEEPVVKKIQRKHEPVVEADAVVNPEEEISIGEFAAAAVAAGIAVVEDEKEMEAAISEMEEEKAASQAAPASTENVVIEGAHSRLIIDPETGEYTYEFK